MDQRNFERLSPVISPLATSWKAMRPSRGAVNTDEKSFELVFLIEDIGDERIGW